jgi:RimJ/RimL family protein N-acetyltransferase
MQTLETPRLLLRPFTLDDAEAFFALVSNDQITRYTGDLPVADLQAARELLLARPLRDYAVHGFGRHAVVEKSTGEVVGFCGLKRLHSGEVEIGYRFLTRCWGLGYATESAREAMRWGREELKLPRIIGQVVRDNTASVRVLEKLGLAYERSITLHEPGELALDVDIYA